MNNLSLYSLKVVNGLITVRYTTFTTIASDVQWWGSTKWRLFEWKLKSKNQHGLISCIFFNSNFRVKQSIHSCIIVLFAGIRWVFLPLIHSLPVSTSNMLKKLFSPFCSYAAASVAFLYLYKSRVHLHTCNPITTSSRQSTGSQYTNKMAQCRNSALEMSYIFIRSGTTALPIFGRLLWIRISR